MVEMSSKSGRSSVAVSCGRRRGAEALDRTSSVGFRDRPWPRNLTGVTQVSLVSTEPFEEISLYIRQLETSHDHLVGDPPEAE